MVIPCAGQAADATAKAKARPKKKAKAKPQCSPAGVTEVTAKTADEIKSEICFLSEFIHSHTMNFPWWFGIAICFITM